MPVTAWCERRCIAWRSSPDHDPSRLPFRRLDGIDEIVLALPARGLTTAETAAHFDEVYGASVSRDTASREEDGNGASHLLHRRYFAVR